MKKLINSLVVVLLCMVTLLSCEESTTIVEDTTELKEVRIAVVLPEKDREQIWNNALDWAAENIRKANNAVTYDFPYKVQNGHGFIHNKYNIRIFVLQYFL